MILPKFNSLASPRAFILILLLAFTNLNGLGHNQTALENRRRVESNTQGSQQVLELKLDQPTERELAGGQSDQFQIKLEAGQFIHALFTQKEINLQIKITGPDNQPLTLVNDVDARDGVEQVSLVANLAGLYKIEVRSLEKPQTQGHYQASVVELRAATEGDREWARARLRHEAGMRLIEEEKAESYRASIVEFEQALEIWRRLGDKRMQALSLSELGSSYRNLGENQKALPLYQEMLALWHELGDRRQEARALSRLAVIYYILGDSQKAIDYYERALPILSAAGDRYWEGWNLNAYGVLRLALGEYQKALELFEESYRIRHDIGDAEGELTTLKNIGIIYEYLGDPRRALEYYERSSRIAEGAVPRREKANTLVSMGGLYVKLGEYQKALDFYQQGLQIHREIGAHLEEAKALEGMAQAYVALGQGQKAFELFSQALAIAREMKDLQGEAIILRDLGEVDYDLGDDEKALAFYQQALDISRSHGYRSTESSILYSMAKSLRRRGKLPEARARIEESLQIVESIRTDLGSQQLRSSYFATQRKKYELYIDLLMQLHRDNPAGGFDALALKASERARARNLLELLNEARVDIHEDVNPALLEQERGLQRQIDANTQKMLGAQQNADAPTALKQQTDELLRSYEELETKIRSQSPRYAALTRPQPLGVREIQQQILDSDTLLLEFSLGTERSYLWLVSQSELKSFELPGQAEIEAAARRVYELMTARGQRVKFETTEERRARIAKADAEYTQAASALSRMLLGPVAAQLGKKRLLIVADGALYYIPFAALPEPTTQGQPLIVEHEIVNSPSASALGELRRDLLGRRPAPRTVAVIADPVFDKMDARVGTNAARLSKINQQSGTANVQGSSANVRLNNLTNAAKDAGVGDDARLPRLPFTRLEANAILSLASATDRKEALDFNANRATVMSRELGQYRIVHFATHGFLDSVHPELSGIVLSLVDERGTAQDGFLSAHDIYNLKLPAELVVLSGCRTGLGKEIKGEGLVGLTRGFMYAGASRVLVSLWDVNDEATSELMARFYKGMLGSEHLSPTVALRRAQASMLREQKWQAPYYWSAFVLQGEPR